MTDVTPDPKSGPRIVDRDVGVRLLLVYGACAACGRPASNAHHLVPRSHGGDDVPENLVGLCGQGNTSGCHGKIHASDPVTAVAIRHSLTPEQVAYITAKKGEGWLERRYPTSLDAANAASRTRR